VTENAPQMAKKPLHWWIRWYRHVFPRETWYWLMTLMWAEGTIVRYKHRGGWYRPAHRDTREKAFDNILAEMSRDTGAPDNAVVLFYSLEPNKF